MCKCFYLALNGFCKSSFSDAAFALYAFTIKYIHVFVNCITYQSDLNHNGQIMLLKTDIILLLTE